MGLLNQSADLAAVLSFLLKIILLTAAGVAGGKIGYDRAQKKFSSKREKRLFDNIQRPVALIPTTDDPLQMEHRLLQSIEFFTVDLLPADARSVDEITSKYRLAVLRYEDSNTFWRVFHALADKQIPLIIYSKPAEIPVPKLQEIQEYYTRYTLCNTPVRLVSDVFAIMSVYPEGK